MSLSFIPECYVDTNLVETLVPPTEIGYNHQKGCGTVAKLMQEKFFDSFAVGIIDKDKKAIDYLNEFDEVIISGSLILHKHKTKPHYIIQISPAIEQMIIANAMAVGINIADYGLPSEFNKLKKESKSKTSKSDDRFKRLFKALKKANAPDFEKMEKWIVYLKDHPYDADMFVIKAL